MPTKLYFHDATNDQAGTYPTGEQSARTAEVTAAGANTLRKMNTTIGAAQVSQAATTMAQTTTQDTFWRFFTSPPLEGNQQVGNGNLRYNTADSESNLNANHWVESINIYVWRPSNGTLVGFVRDAASLGASEPTSINSEQVSHMATITGNAVNALDGDVVICEVWSEHSQAMAAAYTITFYYDGTTENETENAVVSNHASWVELPETLVFEAAAATSVGWVSAGWF